MSVPLGLLGAQIIFLLNERKRLLAHTTAVSSSLRRGCGAFHLSDFDISSLHAHSFTNGMAHPGNR